MRFRLKSYDQVPPGSYVYQQTKGIKRKFGPLPSIEMLAGEVSSFRTANNLPRASIQESLIDVDQYTCWRLGGMRAFCVAVDDEARAASALSPTSPIAAPCYGCGASIPA